VEASWAEYLEWRKSTQAGKPKAGDAARQNVEALLSIVQKTSNTNLVRAILDDVVAHSLVANGELPLFMRKLLKGPGPWKKDVLIFLRTQTIEQVDALKEGYAEYLQQVRKTLHLDPIYMMVAQLDRQMRRLKSLMQLVRGQGISGFLLGTWGISGTTCFVREKKG